MWVRHPGALILLGGHGRALLGQRAGSKMCGHHSPYGAAGWPQSHVRALSQASFGHQPHFGHRTGPIPPQSSLAGRSPVQAASSHVTPFSALPELTPAEPGFLSCSVTVKASQAGSVSTARGKMAVTVRCHSQAQGLSLLAASHAARGRDAHGHPEHLHAYC